MSILIKVLSLALFSTFVFAGEEKVTLPNSTKQQNIKTWAPTPLELQNALKVTNEFISEYKEGNSSPGWDLVSDDLKGSVSKDEWEAVFSVLKNSYGERKSSEFNRAIKTNKLPSGLAGDIILVILIAEFEKEKIGETLTLISKNGVWYLASYNYQVIG
ncbi:DUF4019 domain-containing protein [Shewanella sp. HL-SH4]|jgi:hypothetical protein|uniref:DUF4019 domain-containing protein n=1 Tax=Alteromonadales TaxID=135622 RepID=UPI000C3272C3|nr:DUF4019 domain-containing protein [Colwellia sp. 12G3]PKI15270.1 hypothetical protein CXF71_13095 [Colwellia sp. 12G3]